MEECRLHDRIDYDWQCNLHLSDTFYLAKVKNISFGGALVYFYSSPPRLQSGDNCNICMIGEFLCEYSCEVVRAEAPYIALTFIGMHKFKAVEH